MRGANPRCCLQPIKDQRSEKKRGRCRREDEVGREEEEEESGGDDGMGIMQGFF
jgi:hypothetical protein